MEPPSLETVYQAISVLHDNPNGAEKEKASIWLGKVQDSIHSWKIADELLQHKKDLQSCYFAAQTMRSKVQHNLSELPAEAVTSLRDSLVAHLEAVTVDTSPAIVTQLSLALADLALQMQAWQHCVTDLIKQFSGKNDLALLEILTVLPQEVDSTSLKLGENRREDIKSELRSNSQAICLFLKNNLTNSQSSHIALKIVKCMTSWIQVRAIDLNDISQNGVVAYCLQVLSDYNSIDTLHDAASDCVCAVLHCLEEINNENVEKLIFDSVATLETSYHMAVAHEEEEKAANYARVFTELGETFLEKIIVCAASGNTHFAMRSLELALVCVGHHDYEVAQITFNLWYRLSQELYERDVQALTDVFKPHVERLIAALARHCQCEPDYTHLPDEGSDFHNFRVKVMELIKDVVFIIGSSSVFRQMFASLQTDISWEQTEAALYVMQSVAKNILPEEYDVVPKVVEAILNMPEEGAHPAVRKTCMMLLGELCEWIDRHPKCLDPSLQCLLRALPDKHLSSTAANALQSVCKACRSHMGVHIGELLQIVRAVDSLPLPPDAAVGLMRGVAATIGGLPHQQLTVAMREAVSVQLNALTNLVNSEGVTFTKGSLEDPVISLDRVAALFRDTEARADNGCQHPCLPALLDAWPVIKQVMVKYQSDTRVMERLCRALRFALRCVGRHAAPLLEELVHEMANVYAAHSHSCLLYLASILVDEMYQEPTCTSHLIGLLQALMPRAFELLQKPDGLRDNPDTVDDLFRLCIRFLQRIPVEFLGCGAGGAALRCAALACALDHRDANASVMKFLFDVLYAKQARRSQPPVIALVEELIASSGEELMCALLEAATMHLHAYMLPEVAEVMLQLVNWQHQASPVGHDWLNTAVARLPRDKPATPTQHQCLQFHHYALRAETAKEMTRMLRDFARLYR